MLLLIDNYDSFVHNLARYCERLGAPTRVVRNDALTLDDLVELRPQAIILSPGPCAPDQAGVSLELARQWIDRVPLLGVCLGHQVIAQALGAAIVRSPRPVHGQSSLIEHDASGLFADLPSPLRVGRYHSLVVDPATLPTALEVTARSPEGIVMAFQHRQFPVFGVQFHPESLLTQGGYTLLSNFLRVAGFDVTQQVETLWAGELPLPSAPRILPQQPVTF